MKYLIALVLFTSVCKAEMKLSELNPKDYKVVKPWELDWSKAKPKQQQMNCTCTVVQPEIPKAQVEEDTEQREPQQEEEN